MGGTETGQTTCYKYSSRSPLKLPGLPWLDISLLSHGVYTLILNLLKQSALAVTTYTGICVHTSIHSIHWAASLSSPEPQPVVCIYVFLSFFLGGQGRQVSRGMNHETQFTKELLLIMAAEGLGARSWGLRAAQPCRLLGASAGSCLVQEPDNQQARAWGVLPGN